MSHEPAENSMETITQKPTENGQPGSLRSGDLLGVRGNAKATPRVNQWWNAYRSGAITAADFKEAVQGMERELAQVREELEKSEAANEVAAAALALTDPVIDKLTKERDSLRGSFA